jgi:DNA modification methylase
MILNADALHIPLASKSVHCIVTSPPYYGLRDYGVPGQLGLEPTPEEYIANMVQVFREARRVLRDDGTLWVNIGDSYNGSAPNKTGNNGFNDGRTNRSSRFGNGGIDGLKPKDLIGIPWMLAFALRADGWYLRSEIIWHKPNPMPESVTDRPTKAHEQVFLLSKSARYWYDAEAVREESSGLTGGKFGGGDSAVGRLRNDAERERPADNGFRNARSVWTIATQPTPFAHFATMPEKLAEKCILAGCPRGGIVLDPFFGSGTTGIVATKNGRRFVGLDLSFVYLSTIAKKRVITQIGMGL